MDKVFSYPAFWALMLVVDGYMIAWNISAGSVFFTTLAVLCVPMAWMGLVISWMLKKKKEKNQ